MKISELIAALEAIKADKGDLHSNVECLECISRWMAIAPCGEWLDVKVRQ